MRLRHPQGNLLLEVLVATSIGVVFALTIATLVSANSRLITSTRNQTQAVAFAKESMERMYALKDADFESIAAAGTGYMQILQQGNTYVISPDINDPHGEVVHEEMRRTVYVEVGKRNAAGGLSDEGAEDPNARKVTVKVQYFDRDVERNVTLIGYLTKWK